MAASLTYYKMKGCKSGMDIPAEFRRLLDAYGGDLERKLIARHLEGGTVEALLQVAVSELKGAMQDED